MRQFSVGKNLVADTKTTLYTVPGKHIAELSLLYAHNGTSSAKDFSAWWYDASFDVEIPIVYEYALSANDYLKFDGGAYILLEENDEIRVKFETGAVNSSCIITVSLIPQLSDMKHN